MVVVELPPLPDVVSALSDALRQGLDRILGDAFASLFLYGAVAFPRPEAWRIDFDYHALVHRPLHDADRGQIDALASELAQMSELGAELDGYFVLLADAGRPEPPRHQLDLRMRDNVWALHRADIHAGRYFIASGIDPRGIVPEPTWPELEAGLRAEMHFVETHPDAQAFGILNSARILYSFEMRDVVLSKFQAGTWALESIPPAWNDGVRAAMRWYERAPRAGDENLLDDCAAPFVEYVSRLLALE